MGLNISSHTIKTIMLTHTKLIAPPRYTSSFSFSLLDNSKYLTSWVKKFRDEIQTPPKGSNLLRGFSAKHHVIPNLYLELTHMNSQSFMNISLLHIPHLALSYM